MGGRVIVLLQGRFAGKKAVVVKAFDDGSRARPFGHCLVAGVDKAPLKVNKTMSKKKDRKADTRQTICEVRELQPHDANSLPGPRGDRCAVTRHRPADGHCRWTGRGEKIYQ